MDNSSQSAIKLIQVGFSRPKAKFVPFADAIRAVLGTPFSHVYIKFKTDSFDRVLIYQASGLLVNFIGESRFAVEENVITEFSLEVSEDTFIKTVQFAIDNAGVPYGISQIFGILYVKALALFGVKAKNPFRNGNSNYVCSELVAQILKEIIGLDVQYDLDLITPKEVYELLKVNHILETL